jgi:DNA-binding MarR family transcriptional regulator
MNTLVYTVQLMNNKQKEETATLEILQAIENQNDVTQRHLADKLDIALGLANSYLKRCVRKGLIKVHQAPANRYLYYLTPQGFAEKSRLTAAYLSSSFNFYRDASFGINQIYQQCETNNLNRILFCGVSELAEIASIRIHDYQLKVVGVFDQVSTKDKFLNLPVWNSIEKTDEYDALLLTTLKTPQKMYEYLILECKPDSLFVPSILGVKIQ